MFPSQKEDDGTSMSPTHFWKNRFRRPIQVFKEHVQVIEMVVAAGI